ncbi:LysR family transcriptional regulator [Acinetobacter nectaris]|uniref:LysR family transcriptional regulator n=1 Tax=Acinetobacter nectaris TaxID=1219382 RepID=UPI001F182EF4|nr:LysR family transcriptional regulator [Acinetobacter nectaris]MCF8998384.1 LysR family transcriptional regulator [Acinetobacter nectaris]MCF9028421.1 LysR family transcriptional regulator [Acinetobacter nectaris]
MNTPFSRFSTYFMAVARTGNLRQAAEQLYISVSAVHRQIVLAEDELGVELFERLTNGMRLTLAGELLYADLLKWKKDFQVTQTRFDEIQGLTRGTIDIACIAALADSFLMDCMSKMSEKYPWISFNIHVNESDDVAHKVIHNEVDFGLIFEPKQHRNLEVISFIEIPIGFVISPQHSLAQSKEISLSNTLDQRHITAHKPLVIQERIEAIYQHHQIIPTQHIICNDIEMIRSLLKQNLGLSILSYLDVMNSVLNKELCFIPIKDRHIHPLTLALCTAPKRQISKAAQVMLSEITQTMQTLNMPF